VLWFDDIRYLGPLLALLLLTFYLKIFWVWQGCHKVCSREFFWLLSVFYYNRYQNALL